MGESSVSEVKIEQIVAADDLRSMNLFVENNKSISDLRSLSRLLFDYGVIFGCVAASEIVQSSVFCALAVLIIAGRQHGLMMLIHEAVHGHLYSNRKINDLLAEVFCSLPLMINFQGYRWNHLTHHQKLNTEKDPDWARKKSKGWVFPKDLGSLSWFFLKEVFFEFPKGRIIRIWNMIFFRGIPLRRRVLTCAFYIFQFGILIYFGSISGYLLYWLLPLWLVVPFIFLVRSIAEHFALSYRSELAASRDVKANFFNRIFIPHYGSYHLTHHLYPQVPAYRLKRISEYLHKNEEFSKHSEYNDGYFWGSNTLLQRILINKKRNDLGIEKQF